MGHNIPKPTGIRELHLRKKLFTRVLKDILLGRGEVGEVDVVDKPFANDVRSTPRLPKLLYVRFGRLFADPAVWIFQENLDGFAFQFFPVPN
jgi:hypothetical protein